MNFKVFSLLLKKSGLVNLIVYLSLILQSAKIAFSVLSVVPN